MYVDFGVQIIKYKMLQHFSLDFVNDISKKNPDKTKQDMILNNNLITNVKTLDS